MTATQVIRRAWEVRPGSLETPAGVIAVCLGDILFGVPALASALVLSGAVIVIALLTALSELRAEAAAPGEVPDGS